MKKWIILLLCSIALMTAAESTTQVVSHPWGSLMSDLVIKEGMNYKEFSPNVGPKEYRGKSFAGISGFFKRFYFHDKKLVQITFKKKFHRNLYYKVKRFLTKKLGYPVRRYGVRCYSFYHSSDLGLYLYYNKYPYRNALFWKHKKTLIVVSIDYFTKPYSVRVDLRSIRLIADYKNYLKNG